jgi:hypothetical protein
MNGFPTSPTFGRVEAYGARIIAGEQFQRSGTGGENGPGQCVGDRAGGGQTEARRAGSVTWPERPRKWRIATFVAPPLEGAASSIRESDFKETAFLLSAATIRS